MHRYQFTIFIVYIVDQWIATMLLLCSPIILSSFKQVKKETFHYDSSGPHSPARENACSNLPIFNKG